MKLFVFGLNHRSAPVEIREKLDFTPSKFENTVEFFNRKELPHCHGVVLSTCNRVETYCTIPDSKDARNFTGQFSTEIHGVDLEQVEEELYFQRGIDCAEHLYRVASGIDSMVVGETEILGQVKDAYYSALSEDITTSVLNELFESALRVGKRVRTETKIGDLPVSVSSVAVDMAEYIFDTIAGKRILTVGAGEMGEQTCRYLNEKNPADLVVASRTYDHARSLAQRVDGTAVPYDGVEDHLKQVDIVITQTGADQPVLTYEQMSSTMEKRDYRNLFIIDIAVPRDVEEECETLSNLYLYNIDDLEEISKKNQTARRDEIKSCEKIIRAELDSFREFLDRRDVKSVLRLLDAYSEKIEEAEIERIKPKLNSEENLEKIEVMAERLTGKLLHPLRDCLPRMDGTGEALLQTLKKKLDDHNQ